MLCVGVRAHPKLHVFHLCLHHNFSRWPPDVVVYFFRSFRRWEREPYAHSRSLLFWWCGWVGGGSEEEGVHRYITHILIHIHIHILILILTHTLILILTHILILILIIILIIIQNDSSVPSFAPTHLHIHRHTYIPTSTPSYKHQSIEWLHT